MADYPLLVFSTKQRADKTKQSPGFAKIASPSSGRQRERLTPQFDRLQRAFEREAANLQKTELGIDPEKTLVLETARSVQNFVTAVKRIEGFEWLLDDVIEVDPDDDFYNKENPSKPLSGAIYLIMSDSRGLKQMISLFNEWSKDQTKDFGRGFSKFKDLFKHLKSIREWDFSDRLDKTGIIGEWESKIDNSEYTTIEFQIELWCRESKINRRESTDEIKRLIKNLNGKIIKESVIEEIQYHSLLVELKNSEIKKIFDEREVPLTQCSKIMFFRPAPQASIGYVKDSELGELKMQEDFPLPDGDPVVALFDGVPLNNHALLSNRLIIDDPDELNLKYGAGVRSHGTEMSSVIIYGDLEANEHPLSQPLYVRPVMHPVGTNVIKESFPEGDIAIDLIHRSVKRIFKDSGNIKTTPSSIKVINFSIGDQNYPFANFMSPLARLIDWLSVEYKVLFIISAGNTYQGIELNLDDGKKLENLSQDEIKNRSLKAIYESNRDRRLLSPAESINGLTIGSMHSDSSTVQNQYALNLFDSSLLLPSPISPFGFGYRNSVKPDFVFPGGRELYRRHSTSSNTIEPIISNDPPGIKVACASNSPADVNKVKFNWGTSHAAALVTRAASKCHDVLTEISKSGDLTSVDIETYGAPLLKAMLVHGCEWGEIESEILAAFSDDNLKPRDARRIISRWIGYGNPDIEKVLSCTEKRATVLGFGSLDRNEAHVFKLPLPGSLFLERSYKRLTVTLAYNSPINPSNQRYRVARLWFELDGIAKDLFPKRLNSDWQRVKKGTVQHEIFTGEKAAQASDDEVIEIKVNCADDADRIKSLIYYGIAISVEVKNETNIPVYQEVKDKLATITAIRESEKE